jgi:hypothetical protein
MSSRMCSRAFAALAVCLSACISTNAVRLGTGAVRPSIAISQVAVYRTADQVPRRYEEVALLNSTGASQWTNEAQMLENMRKVAGQMGANAVILDALSEPGAGAKVAAAIFRTTTERKGRAIAVYVLPEGITVARQEAVASVATGSTTAFVQTSPGAVVSVSPVSLVSPPGVNTAASAELLAPSSARPTNAVVSSAAVAPMAKTAPQLKALVVGSNSPESAHLNAATAVIGAPQSEDARERAVDAYRAGRLYMDRHEWGKAETKFRGALQLDGSVAEYHGALGSVLLVLERWADAQASLSAAVLLDGDNVEYRRMLKEARSHR